MPSPLKKGVSQKSCQISYDCFLNSLLVVKQTKHQKSFNFCLFSPVKKGSTKLYWCSKVVPHAFLFFFKKSSIQRYIVLYKWIALEIHIWQWQEKEWNFLGKILLDQFFVDFINRYYHNWFPRAWLGAAVAVLFLNNCYFYHWENNKMNHSSRKTEKSLNELRGTEKNLSLFRFEIQMWS